MSRPKRGLTPTFIVYCEGDTEYNYINTMKKKPGIRLSIKPINMHGGGYTNFLAEIKTGTKSNYIAKFVIIDLDRLHKHYGEKEKLLALINYCKNQNNKDGNAPYFLIVNNPDFEYIGCLHIPSYKGQGTKAFIEKTIGFGNIDQFKNKEDIYTYLNSKGNSCSLMITALNKNKFLYNKYQIIKKKMDVKNKSIEVNWDYETTKGSNINELFDIFDW